METVKEITIGIVFILLLISVIVIPIYSKYIWKPNNICKKNGYKEISGTYYTDTNSFKCKSEHTIYENDIPQISIDESNNYFYAKYYKFNGKLK